MAGRQNLVILLKGSLFSREPSYFPILSGTRDKFILRTRQCIVRRFRQVTKSEIQHRVSSLRRRFRNDGRSGAGDRMSDVSIKFNHSALSERKGCQVVLNSFL
jgi:hypothetical protein